MSYRLQRRESLVDGVKRIAAEQIDKGIGEIDDAGLGPHDTVHQVRKRCKKMRGLVRLVRTAMDGAYDLENAWYRDAAKTVSRVRDAEVMVETLDALVDVFEDQLDRSSFRDLRGALIERKRSLVRDEIDLGARIDELRRRLVAGRARVDTWPIEDDGFATVAGGLRKTYRRARKRMVAARRDETAAALHEWRKRVKYHWYHVRILRDVWRPVVGAHRDVLGEVADLLGDDHDLAVLRKQLLRAPSSPGCERDVQVLVGLIDRRRVELQRLACPLGARAFAEKPAALVERFAQYWRIWKHLDDGGSPDLD